MKIQTTILTLLGALDIHAAHAADDSVGVLYLKNNSSITGHIFVDGEYQGYVPPGNARYSVREGFVTRNSGVQPDGSVKQNYSHGGWASKSSIIVTIKGGDSNSRYEAKLTVSGDNDHKAYLWWGEKDPGAEPGRLIWENSSQIVSAKKPITPDIKEVFKLAAQTKSQDIKLVGVWKDSTGDCTITISKDGSFVRNYSGEFGTSRVVGKCSSMNSATFTVKGENSGTGGSLGANQDNNHSAPYRYENGVLLEIGHQGRIKEFKRSK